MGLEVIADVLTPVPGQKGQPKSNFSHFSPNSIDGTEVAFRGMGGGQGVFVTSTKRNGARDLKIVANNNALAFLMVRKVGTDPDPRY